MSQQIRKLEHACGAELLRRTTASGQISLTEEGEVLLQYSRRILTLSREAEYVVAKKRSPKSIVRLGLPEDVKAGLLTDLLANFGGEFPDIRVDTECGLTAEVEPLLRSGELDLALMKREVGSGPCLERWPEELVWVGTKNSAARADAEPVPLAVFPQGCLYRERAIHAMEVQNRPWRIAYTSASLTGILAAVSSGLAITLLARTAVPGDLSILNGSSGFPAVPATELALVVSEMRAFPAVERLGKYICASMQNPKSNE